MRRVGGHIFVIVSVVIVQRFSPDTATPERSVALALGFALIAASLLGHLTELLRLPRLSGYLLFGLLCGPYLLNLITSSMARELEIINGLAIGLIAFIAGLELNLKHLRQRMRAMLIIGGVSIVGLFTLLTIVFWMALASFCKSGGSISQTCCLCSYCRPCC